jgi:hypothetical protein
MRSVVLTVFLITLLLAGGATADQVGFTRDYLEGLRKSDAPSFLAACSEDNGTAVLVVGVGRTDGMILEYEGGKLVNPTTVKVGDGAFLIDQTNGGEWSIQRVSSLLRELVKQRFSLGPPATIEQLAKIKPKGKCKVHEPD